MIVLFTDFGLGGPYLGQVKAVLHVDAPNVAVIDLFSDAPAHDPKASSYLLGAYCEGFPDASVFLAVVDPGVGGERRALVIRAGKYWYVGPDNGLAEILIRRQETETEMENSIDVWEIIWKPDRCAASFHGRDIFAPIAARIACGEDPDAGTGCFRRLEPSLIRRSDWPDDLPEIVYIDHFGNAMTGVRSGSLEAGQSLAIDGISLKQVETFTDVPPGDMFCYGNANGLMEIAVNQERADEKMGLEIGKMISINRL